MRAEGLKPSPLGVLVHPDFGLWHGYRGAIGENLAGGQATLEGAIEGWLNSAGHRATLLSDRFVEFGLAVGTVPAERRSRYGIYWCFLAGGPVENWIAT